MFIRHASYAYACETKMKSCMSCFARAHYICPMHRHAQAGVCAGLGAGLCKGLGSGVVKLRVRVRYRLRFRVRPRVRLWVWLREEVHG